MSAPDLVTEASAAGTYPSKRFGQRERKMLETVLALLQAITAKLDADTGVTDTDYSTLTDSI